jgi:hypothetical protein
MKCRRIAAEIEGLKRMTADPIARRTQLWLRALEREDGRSITILREADPAIEERVRELIATEGPTAPPAIRDDARRLYGWLQDRHRALYALLDAVECSCPRCAEAERAESGGCS